jgi:hypothetical protein
MKAGWREAFFDFITFLFRYAGWTPSQARKVGMLNKESAELRSSGFAGPQSKSDDVVAIDYPIRYPKKACRNEGKKKKDNRKGVGRFVDHSQTD